MGADRTFDVVSRDSYEDAVDQIAHLRRQIVALKERLVRLNDDATMHEQVIESLAAWDHDEAWSGWHKYYAQHWHDDNPDKWRANMKRWDRQAETPYARLSEQEKESDRKEARRILEVICQALGVV